MASWATSWSGVFDPIGQLVGQTWTEEPLIVLGLLVPCVLAFASRDLTAVAVSALLAIVGFLAVHVSVADWHQAGVVLVTCLAGILVGIQASRLRRTRRSFREAHTDLTRIREELADVRSKYDREVHWRRAAERVTSERSPAATSASS
jgi:peptidoglycan/LPS O-acetylase OafA/YrhL